jgi:ABC-2 type transport system permease protein
MIVTIARKEFRDVWRDGRLRWMTFAVWALLLAAFAAGWKHHHEFRTQQAEAQQVMRAEWVNQTEKNPHEAAHYGTFAFKPQPSLTLIDKGVDAYTGVAVYLEAHQQNDFQFRPAQDQSAAARFGELTAAAVLQLLVPLLLVLLAFAAFAGERESGTLRQVLSLGVSRQQFALGKLAGLLLTFAVLLLPAILLGSLALLLAGDASFSVARWLLLVAGYVVYFVTVLCLALAVSALAASSRAALVILIAGWFVGALIVPRFAADASRRLYPTSTVAFRQAIEEDFENGINGHDAANQRNEQFKQQVLARYEVKAIKDLPVNYDGLLMQADEEYRATIFDQRFGALWDTWERQNRFQMWCGLLAPVQAVRALSMGLVGSDFTAHRDFAVQAEAYRRTLVRALNEDMIQRSKSGDWDYKAGRNLFAGIADFSYAPTTTATIIQRQAGSGLTLLLWLGASVALLAWALRRMKAD